MLKWRKLVFKDKRRVAALTGLGYLAASVAWIALSDQVAAFLATNKQELAAYQTYKGFGFVSVMSLLVAAGAYLLEHRREQVTNILHSIRTDALTGLPIGAVAEEIMERQLERGGSFSLLLLDVRQLSRINEGLGRSVCDTVLQRVAQRIRDNAGPANVVARLEGDKFLVVLPSGADEEQGRGIGAKICSAFDDPIIVDETDINLDLWIALAMAPRDGRTASVVLDTCERALQRAKTANQVCTIFSGAGDSQTGTVLKLEADLRRAIREQQFGIVLQPQIDLETFRVVGAEALVRWHEPERGTVSPAEFIPVAESLGLVGEITNQVLDKALEHWSKWSRRNLDPIRLGVNLSGVDLNSERIISAVAAALARHRMPGRYLTLEITETWLAQTPEIALSIVERLRDLDVQIALDDFGTGYSSLSQLTHFAVDCIKIDRSFVTTAHEVSEKVAVLDAIKHLADALGTKTLAEGVETVEELILLNRLGFDEVQGFLFGKPLTPPEFEARYLGRQVIQEFEPIRKRLHASGNYRLRGGAHERS